jgi:hypothetical protein
LELASNQSQIEVGQPLSITIILKQKNRGQVGLPAFRLPGTETFTQQGTSTTSRVAVLNGQVSTITEKTILFAPQKKGVFTIGPVRLALQDENNQILQQLESNTLEITVREPGSITEAENNEAGSEEEGLSTQEQSILDSEIFRKGLIIFCLMGFFGAGILMLLLRPRKISLHKTAEEADFMEINNNTNNSEAEIVIPEPADENFFPQLETAFNDFLMQQKGIIQATKSKKETLKKIKSEPYYQAAQKILEAVESYRYAKIEGHRETLKKLLEKIIQERKEQLSGNTEK